MPAEQKKLAVGNTVLPGLSWWRGAPLMRKKFNYFSVFVTDLVCLPPRHVNTVQLREELWQDVWSYQDILPDLIHSLFQK